jgi:hypothetical protein
VTITTETAPESLTLLVEAGRGRFRLGDLQTILQLGDAQSRLRPIEVGAIERGEHFRKPKTFFEEALPERAVRPLKHLDALVCGSELPSERVGMRVTSCGHSTLARAWAVILAGIGTLAQ